MKNRNYNIKMNKANILGLVGYALIAVLFKFIPGSPGNEFNLVALLIPVWLPFTLFLAIAFVMVLVELFIDLVYRNEP